MKIILPGTRASGKTARYENAKGFYRKYISNPLPGDHEYRERLRGHLLFNKTHSDILRERLEEVKVETIAMPDGTELMKFYIEEEK